MIGRMCRFYGFTEEHCLKMKASRFFLMLECIDKIHGQELANLCFVARASAMSQDGFTATVSFFEKMGQKEIRPPDVVIPNLEINQDTLKASSVQAKERVMGIFANDKRINRKVVTLKENPRRRH